ncbi:MAG TPA: nickel pincer cofactor biosynthesis protein LarC [Acidimicrobiales bacterium]|nr:nickel pincer cofactor biosynthesis protein LarC [Acidimicrobiales bacterium]
MTSGPGGSTPPPPTIPVGTRTVAWFHCFAGIAGDMALGSLIDAGAELDEVVALLERLPFGGWALDVEPVLRGGIAASRAIVMVQDHVVVRTYAHIVGLVEEARLPARVAARSLATFAALAEVEAGLHRRPVDQVHFHEVGGHDTIIDVVGTAAALELLGVDEVRASAVATGTGMVRAAHGMLPNPAPAVVGLLQGVPTWGRDLPVELTTPTGAALLAALSSGFGPMPAMEIAAQGFGAGTRELEELPNCTQVVLGVRTGTSGTGGGDPEADAGQPVAVLEVTVDDVTGEQLAHAVATLLESGAHDAWVTPVVMKKGRPGHVVQVLCDPARVSAVRAVLRSTTGSLGVRLTSAQRWPAARTVESVVVAGQLIRVKVGAGRTKAEHDDVAAGARRTGLPLRELALRAEAQWLAEHGGGDGTAASAAPLDRTLGTDNGTDVRT